MKTILFVGVTNVGSTQICEALLDHLARARGLPIRAESAGVIPRWDVDPAVVAAMEEIGVLMDHYSPKLLMQWHLDNADRIILMHRRSDPEHTPPDLADCEDWDLPDVAGQPVERVREVRDLIRDRLERLIAEEG